MRIFYSLGLREAVHALYHLHTDIQVEVALRTYIFSIFFKNVFVHGW